MKPFQAFDMQVQFFVVMFSTSNWISLTEFRMLKIMNDPVPPTN